MAMRPTLTASFSIGGLREIKRADPVESSVAEARRRLCIPTVFKYALASRSCRCQISQLSTVAAKGREGEGFKETVARFPSAIGG
jgi:hypothetical protein